MKIIDLRIRQVTGEFTYAGIFWKERIGMPLDIYPEFKKRGTEAMFTRDPIPLGGDRYKLVRNFLEIDTDEGITGIAGPLFGSATLFYLGTQLKTLLRGEDPLATERLWDIMYRNAVHGRKGDNMLAISYVDIALWDIKGKYLEQPVYRLLGGPVQDKIPAYASTVAYSLEPEDVSQQVKVFKEQGYCGSKWFLRDGPIDGASGIARNIAIAEAAREASGPEMLLMFDAWNSWDVPYTLKMDELMADYDVYWFEEPVLPDLVDSYADLTARCHSAIAGGEHNYTRWGTKLLLDSCGVDYYQFDPAWGGGISETLKVAALCSSYDIKLIVHGSLVPANAQLTFTQNAYLAPMMEYLTALNEPGQYFLKNPVKPLNGYFYPPTVAGVGCDIDESKIISEREISF
jgi:L-alanine-DL-glutamate epimerase-like enolase superfamily enzyme